MGNRRPALLAALVGVVALAATSMSVGVAVMISRPDRAEPSGSAAATATVGSASNEIQNFPPQAAGLAYGDPAQAAQYAYPGGLVVAGRDNFDGKEFRDVSAAGGSVLLYLDPIIDNPHGRYHELLIKRSECGPATSHWPGNYRANSWGYLNDFRVGSVLQTKLECVLEKMVQENPHMAGWLADDLGSRSWFPDFDWVTFPDRAAYRDGAIELTKTFRRVANRHGLIFLVNRTWAGGPIATAGGGYPNPARSGNALADGGVVEHHDSEISYFGPYGCSKQWAAQSPITRGKAFNYAMTATSAGSLEYLRSSCYAFVNQQTDYGVSQRFGTTHPTGLPTRAH